MVICQVQLDDGLELRVFDPHHATDAEFTALNELVVLINQEGWPFESITAPEDLARRERSLAPFEERHLWAIWQETGEVAGLAHLNLAHTGFNKHVAHFFVGVHPAHSRQGIATHLMSFVTAKARETRRTLLLGWSSSLQPAGAAFLTSLGARVGNELEANQLDLFKLDLGILQRWKARGQTSGQEFEIGFWDGAYPEEDLAAIADLHAVMNSAPRGDLRLEDERVTPERLRGYETSLAQNRIERWTFYARHRPRARLVGYTEVLWDGALPAVIRQGDTGVFPEWRNRGLGTWLKAEMMQRILRDRPKVRFVRTFNATTNASMISINRQLGFELVNNIYTWQVDVDQVEHFLAAASE